ncbi:ChaN family lipoprotein [Spirulina subsalsa FACHB-351]|uniref:ChaN family lipoprotein n=1 Tax=Spirulina subsalsa FACHB-351 TaxID=234711 RepID=A0ABT3L5I5_9CYAN|nr:ChaN family lipoprotein [Spirulina subsalsa]MCW6036735.1 ChaN family lipoprotein [Spirulina subsalsa FACHB-351]
MNWRKWFAISLGVALCVSAPYVVSLARPPQMGATVSQSATLSALGRAQIVYLGEIHDNPDHHEQQLRIIEFLHQRNPKLAIALEMFQKPFQPVLDRYLAGEISEEELREQSEYDQRWGFDWEFYAPILRYAKAHQLPVIALNPPTEITRKVARNGLESLSGEDFDYIPPLNEIDTNQPEYREKIAQVFAQHGSHGHSLSLDNFFAAQVLWDETMAHTIAEFWRNSPERQIIVLAGKGHIYQNYGIPSRVERRLGEDLVHYSVGFVHPSEWENRPSGFDLLWQY